MAAHKVNDKVSFRFYNSVEGKFYGGGTGVVSEVDFSRSDNKPYKVAYEIADRTTEIWLRPKEVKKIK